MAFDVQLKFGGKRFADARNGLNALATQLGRNVKDFDPIVQRNLKDLLDTVIEALRARHNTPWRAGQRLPKGKRQGRLAVRSGDLLGSLTGATKGRGANVVGELRGNSLLIVHEEGRTIRAKRAKFLAIPLPAALDSRGVPKRRRPRDWKNTFVIRSKRNRQNLVIMRKLAGGRVEPLYVLKRSTRIPARLGLGVTARTAVPVFRDRIFDQLTRELVKGI